MKKVICVIIIIISLMLNIKQTKRIEPTFSINENEYYVYLLEFSDNVLTTNNILIYFKNIMILDIYPNINKIYSDKLPLKYVVNSSKYSDIVKFKNKYIKLLELNNFKSEIYKASIYGISINKIKIYASNKYVTSIVDNKKIKILKKYE